MKKFFTILFLTIVLASCKQNAETPNQTPANTGNTQVEVQKTSENKNTKITEKTDDFEIDLPEGFDIKEENDIYFIGKKGTNLVTEGYFALSLYTKAYQEQMKKCETVKVPQSIEELEKMTEQEKKDYEPCQWPRMPTDPKELPVVHITKDGDFWLIEAGHEIPVIEKDADSYAETLKLFGVTEKMTTNDGMINLIPEQLVQYFKENTRFKK